MVDGEVVALDESGLPNFNLLQSFRKEASHIQYFIFDLLICNDRDLTRLALSEEIEKLVGEFVNSGMKRTEFCRSRGLALSTLDRHLKNKEKRKKRTAADNRLVAVESSHFNSDNVARHGDRNATCPPGWAAHSLVSLPRRRVFQTGLLSHSEHPRNSQTSWCDR